MNADDRPLPPPGRPVRWYAVEGNRQWLDGGAMYGNAPRAVWERWSPPDTRHRIELACRAMLVEEDSGRRVLCETGIGACFDPKLRDRYGVAEPDHRLLANLAAMGFAPDDIDIVILSHLHFDHAGGLLSAWAEGVAPSLAFPRAHVVVSAPAWERALAPHPRDRASFLPELNALLAESGRLVIADPSQSSLELLGSSWRLHFSDGHTPGLMLAEIATDAGPLVFAGDLIPGIPWIHAPITMGYDRFPERLIDEKTRLLEDLLSRGGGVFLTHDPKIATARIVRDGRGHFAAAPFGA